MHVFLTTLLAILPSIPPSRAAVELENVALRHQNGVPQRPAAKRLKLTVDLSRPSLARLALGVGHRQTRNGPGLASGRLSTVLDLEGATRATRKTLHLPRSPRPD